MSFVLGPKMINALFVLDTEYRSTGCPVGGIGDRIAQLLGAVLYLMIGPVSKDV
jgi:hypothetical protein